MMVVVETSLCRMRMEVVVVMIMVVPVCVMGRSVFVAAIQMTPYLMETKDPVTEQVFFEGYIVDLLAEIDQKTGIKFKIRRPVSSLGQLNPLIGQWSGLIGEVVSKRAEMAAGPLTVTPQRTKLMDFSVPFQYFSSAIVLKKFPISRPSLAEDASYLTLPFSQEVWLTALVAYLLTSVLLYVICYINPYEWRRLCADNQREAESFTCLNTFWFMLSTWLWQGFIRAPRSLGGRLVVTAWWMFAVVFLLTYLASLTNILKVGRYTLMRRDARSHVLNLKDLVAEERRSGMDVGWVKGGYMDAYLQTSSNAGLQRLFRKAEEKGNRLSSVEEGRQRVRDSYFRRRPFAFITDSAVAQQMIQQKPCDVYMVRDGSVLGSYSLAFQKDSDLRERVDLALLELHENGVLKKLEDRWSGGPCQPKIVENPSEQHARDFYSPVTLRSFAGILIILAAGITAGIIVSIFEIIIFRMRKNRAQATRKDKTAETGMEEAPLTS